MLFPTESLIKARRQLVRELEAGNFTEEQMFERALALDANDAIALASLAHQRDKAGDLAAAEEYGWRAVQANPCLHEPWFKLRSVLQKSGASEPLLNGVMELGLRTALRSEGAIEEIAEHAKKDWLAKGDSLRDSLQGTADALCATRVNEPEEVANRLRLHRFMDELLENAGAGLDRPLVDEIVEAGAPAIPHLFGVVRGTVIPEEQGFLNEAMASLAIIGEIGDLAALPELLECVMRDEEELTDSASWAVERIAERRPAATFEALRELAPAPDLQQRCAIAEVLADVPAKLPAKLDLWQSLLAGLEAFSHPDDRHQLFMAVAEAIVFAQNATAGGALVQSLFHRYAELLPRRTKTDLRKLRQTLVELEPMRKLAGKPATKSTDTVYDFCAGEGEYEEEDAMENEDEDFLVTEPIARAPRPGRNDPCWCGSGKKYKKCHLEADENARHESPAQPSTAPHSEAKRIESAVRARLLAFIDEFVSKREFENAARIFFADEQPEEDDQHTPTVEFMDWLVHDYVVPSRGRPVLEEFLKRAPGGFTSRERAMLENWRRSRFSLHEVLDVEPGTGVLLKDLLVGGDGFFVHDVSISQHAVRWDCFVGRVAETEGRMLLNGVMRTVPRHLVTELQEWAQVARERSGLDWDAFLHANSHTLRHKVVALVEEVVEGFTAVSHDGDPIVFSSAVYEILDKAALHASLDAAGELEREDTGDYVWLEPGETSTGGRRLLGHLRIAQDRLTLECMTRERLKRGKKMLKKLANAALRHKADDFKEPPQPKPRFSASAPAAPRPSSTLPPEVESELIHKVLADHYQTWPDTPLPALQGKTPRQAALQPEGRARLIEVFKMMENAEERNRQQGRVPYDFAPLKAELGIDY